MHPSYASFIGENTLDCYNKKIERVLLFYFYFVFFYWEQRPLMIM